MSETTDALDDAYVRLAHSGYEAPNGFVNHGPMAVEALAALDLDEHIGPWARRMAGWNGAPAEPVTVTGFEWEAALGDRARLPEWIGYFGQLLDTERWQEVVALWVPRLMPALSTALFHGAIRVAHAVRAVEAEDNPVRRAELARALGYWAARFAPGQPVPPAVMDAAAVRDTGAAVTWAAAGVAKLFVESPDIVKLHGVTGAMAVELLVPHLTEPAKQAALAQVGAEHAGLFGVSGPSEEPGVVSGQSGQSGPPEQAGRREPAGGVALAAAQSGDPHQVKLVEACWRGWAATGDPVFLDAAETVTGRVTVGR